MISILVPCYNEAENILTYTTTLFPSLNRLNIPYEVIFVNDGSTDATLNGLMGLKQNNNSVVIVSYDKNAGLGIALRRGIAAARGEIIIPLDADLTFHPDQVRLLIDRFNQGDCDCVIGSHFSKGGKLEAVGIHRIILSRVVNVMYKLLFNCEIKSISSIFRLYKSGDVKKLSLSSTGFDINAEILYKLLRVNKVVVEVPVTLSARKYGVSKLNVRKEAINTVKLFSKIFLWRFKR